MVNKDVYIYYTWYSKRFLWLPRKSRKSYGRFVLADHFVSVCIFAEFISYDTILRSTDWQEWLELKDKDKIYCKIRISRRLCNSLCYCYLMSCTVLSVDRWVMWRQLLPPCNSHPASSTGPDRTGRGDRSRTGVVDRAVPTEWLAVSDRSHSTAVARDDVRWTTNDAESGRWPLRRVCSRLHCRPASAITAMLRQTRYRSRSSRMQSEAASKSNEMLCRLRYCDLVLTVLITQLQLSGEVLLSSLLSTLVQFAM